MTTPHQSLHAAGNAVIGDRTAQQDAYSWSTYQPDTPDQYMVAAIADGLGSSPDSGIIAKAAVNLACRIGAGVDIQADPSHLIDLVRVTLPELGHYAETEADAFYEFEFDLGDGHRPDTTLVVATIDRFAEVYVGWVGDSRAYVLTTGGRLIQLSQDHNLAHWNQAHVLTRTLTTGKQDRAHWNPDLCADRAARVLLCTDGVHGVLPDDAIKAALTTTPDPEQAAGLLTDWAWRCQDEKEYADNATALVIDIPSTDPAL